MNSKKYSITFACHNAQSYTQKCIDSLISSGTPLDRLVVVDNASTDNTRDYLNQFNLGGKIYNTHNLGCGTAWNQGVLKLQSEWSIVMNNDVVVAPGWIENLINVAEVNNLKVVSPALIEGTLDYEFNQFCTGAQEKMQGVTRFGAKHAVCMAIHESVWFDIGFFMATPKLLGYEDTIFFRHLERSNIKTGITGSSWIHHFGSITQSLIKTEMGLNDGDSLGHRSNYKLLNESWLRRKLNKVNKKRQEKYWRENELREYNMSLHGLRENCTFHWI